MSFQLRMDGAADIERALAGLERTARGRLLGRSVRAAAGVLRSEARRLAPKGATGTLRKSIAVRTNRRQRHSVSLTMGLRPDGFYGVFVEFGTSHTEAQPFFRPAFESKGDEAVRAFRLKFWTGIRAAAGR